MVLEIDERRRRVSLGIKQCRPNPWEEFAAAHSKGEKIVGSIKSITDFGVFVGLDGNIDGLVHLSDLSWNEPGEAAVRRYSKGEEIETVILSIDADRERISLGIKQLDQDQFSEYAMANERGAIVKGVVQSVAPKEAKVLLAEGVTGTLKAAEISLQRPEDATEELSEGDELEMKILSIDRKNRNIGLSVRARLQDEERQAVKEHKKKEGSGAPSTLGDLIKAQIKGDGKDKDELSAPKKKK